MTITEAFKIIQADETKCAKMNDGQLFYCFEHSTLCVFQVIEVLGKSHKTDPSQYANKKGQESFGMTQILADWEVLNISDL